ncbi:DUF192 domain-containing protein [Bacillus sp. N9]
MSDSVHKSIPYSIKVADTFASRLKGLMFKKTPLHQEGLWIIPCNSIHMFLCVLRLMSYFLIMRENCKNCRKFTTLKVIGPIRHAHSVLELPSGSTHQLGLQIEITYNCLIDK